jgi:hypothetical protein
MEQQPTFEQRVQGREFDWFALDCNGRVGLFASAGCGNVPIQVQQNYALHDSIVETFHLPNYGSLEVWRDYAKYGFYVFDWRQNAGPYERMAIPIEEVSDNIRERILQIIDIPRLAVSFEVVSSVNL